MSIYTLIDGTSPERRGMVRWALGAQENDAAISRYGELSEKAGLGC